MPADTPTILATSGGLRRGRRTEVEFSPLVLHAIELSGATGRPRLCHIGTAGGDQRGFQAWLSAAGEAQGITVTHLSLFAMPSTGDMTGLLLEQDVVWVGGGSVANLLALWRLHGLDQALRQAWQAGVVLSGVSAGSICWHIGGTTDSFGPDLRPVTDGLAFLPYSNGTGLLYCGTQLAEALSEISGKATYRVTRDGDQAREERIEPRVLPGAD